MKKNLIILAITFSLIAFSAQAIAVKVFPSELEIKANPGVLTKEEIMVKNPGENVALYEVYVDNFSDWIKIEPESFILESKKSKKVTLEVKNNEEGIFSTTVSVVAKPLSERKFKANSGIKIPFKVKISEREGRFLAAISKFFKEKSLIYVISLTLFLILVAIFLMRKKRRAKKLNQAKN